MVLDYGLCGFWAETNSLESLLAFLSFDDWGGLPRSLHCCLVAGLAVFHPGCLGPGLLGWAAALGLVGRLGLGLHGERRHRRHPAWERLAPGLGFWVGPRLPHDIVVGCFMPLKRLGCVPNNWGDICNVLKPIDRPGSVG